MWGWNETGQLGFPYKSESSHPLFHFFEHTCQCPKSSSFSHGSLPRDSGQRHHMGGKSQDEEVVYKDEENKEQKGNCRRISDERINPERSQEVINVQASPRLLDFWREDVNICDVQCGDRHTLFMLRKLSHLITNSERFLNDELSAVTLDAIILWKYATCRLKTNCILGSHI